MADQTPRGTRPDPFAQLGLPPRYAVDPAELERAFFERSKELHPDRFAAAPAAERVAALSKARALNDAYALLRRDASRAEHLLAREGITIGDNERIDPELVMALLEEREQLAEARGAGELREVERLAAAMRARRREALDRVAALFAAAEGSAGDARSSAARASSPSAPPDARAQHLAGIKQQLILLRYVDRYLEECDAALDED
ncbi:MAG TPA: iron-sulfur cluster co-chaperone HscB C-terminal domain-containing protein [Kofleriaceae bacterium]|nr:iron-sulfur cluster co-chaperone HscB C-terminal domain-containing protein [Kofleriaceae bacterium]